MQVHNEKEQARQKEIQTIEFKEKVSLWKLNAGAKACGEREEKS